MAPTTDDGADRAPIAHRNLAVIATSTAEVLDALYALDAVRVHLWKRLDKRHAIVNPAAVGTVRAALAAAHIGTHQGRNLP